MSAKSVSLKDVEALHRVKERLDQKLETLQRELVGTRKALHEKEHETKLKYGVIETLCEDKRRLEKELTTYKEHHVANTAKISTLSESAKLQRALQEKIATISLRDEEISSLKGTLLLREERLAVLEYELNVAYRAINVQNKFDQKGDLSRGLGADRETLRSLYFVVAKSQQESHSMSQALAEKDRESCRMKELCEMQAASIASLEHEARHLQDRLESEASVARSSQEEAARLVTALEETQSERDQAEFSSKRLEIELMGKLASLESALEASQQGQRAVTAQLDAETRTRVAVQRRAESLEAALDQLHFNLLEVQAVADQERAKVEGDLLTAQQEQARLRDVDEDNATLRQQLEALRTDQQTRQQAEETLRAELLHAQEEIHLFNYQLVAERAHGTALQGELDHLQAGLAVACRERDEVVSALKQSMGITRELMNKATGAQEARNRAERQLADEVALRKKISVVMLDAMHKTAEPTAYPSRAIGQANARLARSLDDFSWLHDVRQVREALHAAAPQPTNPAEASTEEVILAPPPPKCPGECGVRSQPPPPPPSIDTEIQQLKDDLLSMQSVAKASAASGGEAAGPQPVDDSSSDGESLDRLLAWQGETGTRNVN